MDIFQNGALSFAALSASWLVMSGGIWKLFERIEKVASESAKVATSHWLQNMYSNGKLTDWTKTFSEAFDNIFGTRHLTLKCFYRSSIASIISVFLVTLIWGGIRPGEFRLFLESDDLGSNIFTLFLFSGAFNLIPDYISLLESRYIISRIKTSKDTKIHFYFLLLDLAATFCIGFISFALLMWVTDKNILNNFISLVLPLKSNTEGMYSSGIWFYSTFFTSIWVWLYIGSSFLIAAQLAIRSVSNTYLWFFDYENKPFLSVGGGIIFIISIVYCVLIIYLLMSVG